MTELTTNEFNLYFAKPGSHLTDRDAQIIGTELKRLGSSTAQEIVEAARDENSPLHPYFEWDDTIAAEEYRKDQARYLARSIVKREGPLDEPNRAFLPIRIERSGDEPQHSWGTPQRYTPTEVIRENPEMSRQVLDTAKRQLITWKRTYEMYREVYEFKKTFEPVLLAIENVESEQRGNSTE